MKKRLLLLVVLFFLIGGLTLVACTPEKLPSIPESSVVETKPTPTETVKPSPTATETIPPSPSPTATETIPPSPSPTATETIPPSPSPTEGDPTVYDEQLLITINYASAGLGDDFIIVQKGTKIESLTPKTAVDYVFEGWYLDDEFTQPFNIEERVMETHTIYASYHLTVQKALEVGHLDTAEGEITTKDYFVVGTIKSIVQADFGNMWITDGENDMFVYGVFGPDGETMYRDLEDKPFVGDVIFIRGPFKKYQGVVEVNNSSLVRFVEAEPIDVSDYDAVTIASARDKAVDSLLLVEGVVAQVTYGQNKLPNGVFLVDETGSIYIYSVSLAIQAKVGNTAKVAGKKVHFILDTEQNLAQLHGYQGAIQLDEVIIVELEDTEIDFATDWIEERTLKDIMEADFTVENITGNIFKVNGFLNVSPGLGFTNYYFNDLDEQTGSYSYSMNNGWDFEWLAPYDGQLVTAYIAVINAKASLSGILYRFVPIKIIGEYEYNQDYNTELAVIYYGVPQFQPSYVEGASPEKALLTSFSSERLGIDNVVISYSSGDEDIAKFEIEDGKTYFKVIKAGSVIIRVTATDGEKTYFEDLEILVKEPGDYDTLSIAEVIASPDDTEVTVKGIVAASLVNKVGYYIADETGFIAVETTNEQMEGIELGHMLVIQGVKEHAGQKLDENGNITSQGQIAIRSAVVLENLQGNHPYSSDLFTPGKTVEDLRDISVTDDLTTTGYLVEAVIVFTQSAYSATYYLGNEPEEGEEQLTLLIYSSGANQLKHLEPYIGQKVLVETAPVNWAGQTNYYRWSVFAIIVDGVRVVIADTNFR